MDNKLFNKIVLVTPFKYSFKNFNYLYVQLNNILNLNVYFDSWHIIIADGHNLPKDLLHYMESEINKLLLHYDYEIYIEKSKKEHPAHLKAEFFEKMREEYGDCVNIFYVSLDCDRIFEYNNFSNLVNSLTSTNKKFVIYPVVDIVNARSYNNYISKEINEKEYYKIIEKYGYTILPYIKLKFNKDNYFIETKIGGSGFAIHHTVLTDYRINLLKEFKEHVRGHDIILADTFDKKYILSDSWALHLGAGDYDSYWNKTDVRALKLFSNYGVNNERKNFT